MTEQDRIEYFKNEILRLSNQVVDLLDERDQLNVQVEQLRIALSATRQPHMDYIAQLDKTALQVLNETTPAVY